MEDSFLNKEVMKWVLIVGLRDFITQERMLTTVELFGTLHIPNALLKMSKQKLLCYLQIVVSAVVVVPQMLIRNIQMSSGRVVN